MTLDAARITLRLHRFEVLAFGGLTLLGLGLAWLVAGRLDALGFDGRCLAPTGPIPASCEAAMNAFYEIVNSEAGKVTPITTFVPFLAGLLLGVPIVGRELERGTTRLAWALTPSRMTWLAQRLVPVLLFVAAVGLLSGAAADRLLASTEPGTDPANAFSQFGFRGPVLAARAVFVFGLALLIGTVMGRALPALIVAGLLAVVGITGGATVHDRMLLSEAVELPEFRPGDRPIDYRFRAPDGRLITWDEMERIDPPPTHVDTSGDWPRMPQVALGIPGTRYGEVQVREIGVLAGGSLLAIAGTALIVQRRRPG